MSKLTKTAAIAIAAATMAAATPASATIFEYSISNGDVLTIDTVTQSGTLVGDDINLAFTSADFANYQGLDNYQGGPYPDFSATLDSLSGTRFVNGRSIDHQFEQGGASLDVFKDVGYGFGNAFRLWAPFEGVGDYAPWFETATETSRPSAPPAPPAPPPVVNSTSGGSSTSGGVDVPAPGMLGLFGLALAAIGFGRRRRRQQAAA